MNIQDKVAIVTGGSSGLGKATCQLLARAGAKIAILDNNYAGANLVATKLQALALHCDVSNENNVHEAMEKIKKHLGSPRICINCAGIAPAARLLGKNGLMPLEHFKQVIDVNLIGTFNVTRLAAHEMSLLDPINSDGERGVIINTASIAAFEGQIGQAAYSAAKSGVVGLTLPLARELSRFGIRVNTIAPGLFTSPITNNLPQNIFDTLAQNTPFPKRFGHPREFASLVMHVINNVMLNGTVLRIDGSMRLPF